MPPNRSRRLPGGKVRKPVGRGAATGSSEPAQSSTALAGASGTSATGVMSRATIDTALREEPEDVAPAMTPIEEYRVARTAAAEEPVMSTRRTRAGRQRQLGVRTGPSTMDAAARNYGHIRGDLLRILVIALSMFGIIIALSFVLS